MPRDKLWGFHVAHWAGGMNALLPRPTLGAYMNCDSIPEGAKFGHRCQHGSAPHEIKVLIPKSGNSKRIYAELRLLAETKAAERGSGQA